MTIWLINNDCFHNNDGGFDTDIDPDTNTDTDNFYDILLSRSSSRLNSVIFRFLHLFRVI